MCTAATYQTSDFYFGRTLDYESSYGEEIVILPRKYKLPFLHMGVSEQHYAIIGTAHIANGYPLFYDAVNEKGLCMAGLNFVGNACYAARTADDSDNVAQYEFIPWILSQCADTAEARAFIQRLNLLDTPFHAQMPAAQLHWIIADKNQTITVESMADGIHVYENPAGVLTNNPPFPEQMFRLNDYMHLSPKQPQNHFSTELPLRSYSRGMGALGLPGDLSSQSRFVRAAFVRANSVSGNSETESVSQFFHLLGAVDQSVAAPKSKTDSMRLPFTPPAAMQIRASITTPPITITRSLRSICTTKTWTAVSLSAVPCRQRNRSATRTERRRHTAYVKGNQTCAGAVTEKSAAEKAADQNHHRGHHRGLRHQPHDFLLSLQRYLRSCGMGVPGGCTACAG